MTTIVHVGGRFVAPSEAVVSLLDAGYLLGDGIFATLRGYDGTCFRPEAHLAEIERGAAMLDFPCPRSRHELAPLVDEAARRTGQPSAYVRVTLTRGPPDGSPTLSIVARAMDVPAERAYAEGVAAITVTPRRIPPACIDGTIKTTSYAAQVLARREVSRRGAAEGIQLTVDGALACGTMASLFVVRGADLLTPSLESGCRAGVTRAAVIELAPRVGLVVREGRLDPSALDDADEVFFASTRVECLPIASVDGRVLGGAAAGFPRTRALRAAFAELVRAETAGRRLGA